MRMVEPGGYSGFTEETVGDHGGEFGAANLERDGAVVLQVLGEVDRRHSPLAELALDRIAISQGRAQAREEVRLLPSGRSRLGECSRRELEGRGLEERFGLLMRGQEGLDRLA